MGCRSCAKKNPVAKVATKIVSIAEGWTKLVKDGDTVDLFTKTRLEKCNACNRRSKIFARSNHRLNYICSLCGCPIESKVRSTKEKCDLGYW